MYLKFSFFPISSSSTWLNLKGHDIYYLWRGSQLNSRTLVIQPHRHGAQKFDEVVQAGKGDQETQKKSSFNNRFLRAAAAVIASFYIVKEDTQSFAVKMETWETNQLYESDDEDKDFGGPGKGNSRRGGRQNKWERKEGETVFTWIKSTISTVISSTNLQASLQLSLKICSGFVLLSPNGQWIPYLYL